MYDFGENFVCMVNLCCGLNGVDGWFGQRCMMWWCGVFLCFCCVVVWVECMNLEGIVGIL